MREKTLNLRSLLLIIHHLSFIVAL